MPEAVIEADALLDRGIHGVFVVESVFVCESEAPLGWAVSNCVVDRAPVQTCVAFCVEGLAPFFGMAISKLAANVSQTIAMRGGLEQRLLPNDCIRDW